VIKHNEHRFLIDCGEGTQRQILQSGIGFKHINRILITHSHLDHILGLAGLLSTFMRWETIEQLEIFGGRASLERIHDLLYGVVLRNTPAPMDIRLVEIHAGVIVEEEDFSIHAFPVIHRGQDCFGFRFDEKERRPFLADKAEQLGVPAGPMRRDLVAGLTITLPTGVTINPEDVLGDPVQGTRLVHVGDVGQTSNLIEECRGADLLVIEATYLDEEAGMAKQYSHLTARQAAGLAQQAGVRQLALTHISRRYREKDVLAEAQSVFPNTIIARDFDSIQAKRE
jgi:ribonuclease Z